MTGFGRHRVPHENRFFALQESLAIQVECIVTGDEARRWFERLSRRGRACVMH